MIDYITITSHYTAGAWRVSLTGIGYAFTWSDADAVREFARKAETLNPSLARAAGKLREAATRLERMTRGDA